MTDAPITLGIDVGGTSVKIAALRGRSIQWLAKGQYHLPNSQQILGAVTEAVAGRAQDVSAVGLCVPGVLDETRQRVEYSANVPGLHGLELRQLAAAAAGAEVGDRVRIVNDTLATAVDVYVSRRCTGRLLVLALGTGVGAAVLDDGVPLKVDGDSPGHIGQIDVAVAGEKVVAPDGGAGGLEGYVGAAALRKQYGSGPVAPKLHVDDPPMQALVRAIRICHALYRPNHIVLAGGLGIRLGPLMNDLRDEIEYQLTSLARPGWTFSTGDTDHHAACGAARIAGNPEILNGALRGQAI